MPIKLFQDGEILDAADVNTYFMDQSLVIFDDSDERDAAFGGFTGVAPNIVLTEPVLTEGRICYLKDDDTLYIYTGAAWTAQLATIADGVITTAKLDGTASSEAVTEAKIRAGAVTSGKLGSDLDLNGTTEIDEILETVVINSSALTGTFQVNARSGSVQYFTAAAQTANWIWNIRADATPTLLTTMMDDNQSITFALFVKNGATAYYPTAITVDGAAPASLRWFGGTAITAGNVNSVDCYTITVIKTASTVFEVFASQSKFA